MNALNSENDLTQTTKVPLEIAIGYVKNWLTHLLKIKHFKKHPDQIPRAIYIPIEDIRDFLKDYPEDVAGARIYFGLENLLTKPTEKNPPVKLKGLMVPVLKGGLKDKIHNSTNEATTNIYDFTTPCPHYCDTESELFVKIS